ncbi:MAG: L,D-transpeptidase [Rhodothermales bacterium]
MRLALPLLCLLLALPAWAQETSHFRQKNIADVIERRDGDLDDIPAVYYDYHVVESDSRLEARLKLYRMYGEENKGLLQILNRNDLENLRPGDTLVVPTDLTLDFRAYSPFPRYYPGAREIDKLVVLDKSIQGYAAYEWGKLARWGMINTGTESARTPSGRFNVNWKQDYRVSTLSPGYNNPSNDELWEMYWVMNIHEARGIHLHQYALPMGGPASHGCIRMSDPDARWLYAWTDTWEKTGGDAISSVGATIHEQGTIVLVIGHDIVGTPSPFLYREEYPVVKRVRLPASPYDVPAGTPQQEQFDRLRAQLAGTRP